MCLRSTSGNVKETGANTRVTLRLGYKWERTQGVHSFLCAGHPVFSLVDKRGKPQPSDATLQECQECRYVKASVIHVVGAFKQAPQEKICSSSRRENYDSNNKKEQKPQWSKNSCDKQ